MMKVHRTFFFGAYRSAMRLALQEIVSGMDTHLWALIFSGLLFCVVFAAPDSAACCCFSCCLCSCCGLLLPLFLLLLVLVAPFGPPTVEPPALPPLQCLTFQNGNDNFSYPIETKFAGIPPNFHGKALLLSPPHHRSGPHFLAFIVLGLAPSSSLLLLLCENTPLPLLTFLNVCTAFVAFVLFIAIFWCCLMLVFFVVCCCSCCSCCFCCYFCFCFLLHFDSVCAAAVTAVAASWCYLCCCFVQLASACAACSFCCSCCFSCYLSCFLVPLLLLLLLRLISSRRPLKSQSLLAFVLPKCLYCLFCCLCCCVAAVSKCVAVCTNLLLHVRLVVCAAFPVVFCAALFVCAASASLCCFSCFVCYCFLLLLRLLFGTLNTTLAAFDFPKCQEQLFNN